jgi:hypothetical protein
MKSYCFALVSSLAALQAQLVVAQVGVPEMSYGEYRAMQVFRGNQKAELPGTEYWGVGALEWEMQKTNITSAPLETLLGLSCKQEFTFHGPNEGLSAVRYIFAAGVTNRQSRLDQYLKVKEQLQQAYHSPTHTLSSEELCRGRDAYVQGLEKEYRCEWRGRETIIALQLSDVTLSLEFSQAPTSEARAWREMVQKGREKEAMRGKVNVNVKLSERTPGDLPDSRAAH